MKALIAKAAALFLAAVIGGSLTGCGNGAQTAVKVIENPKLAAAPAQSPEVTGEQKEEKPAEAEKPAEVPAVQEAPQAPEAPEAPAEETVSLASPDNRAKSKAAKELVEKAASMQDYSHAEGADAAPITEVDDNILLLANKTHPLAKDYKASDMQVITKITQGVGTEETHQMRTVAAEALYSLFDGAEAAGYDIRLRTGYRSYSYQNTLYTNYVKNNGEAAANRFSAKPGESEHQTGLCCDVGVNGVGLTDFNNRPEAKWIADHAHEYGFILRYPKDKEDVTGYMYESWHIRYVGKDVAAEIWEQGICLEEYLGITD